MMVELPQVIDMLILILFLLRGLSLLVDVLELASPGNLVAFPEVSVPVRQEFVVIEIRDEVVNLIEGILYLDLVVDGLQGYVPPGTSCKFLPEIYPLGDVGERTLHIRIPVA